MNPKDVEKEFEKDKAKIRERLDITIEQVGLESEKEMAKKLGWNRLGNYPVIVNRPLTDQERLDAGEIIAHNQVKIRDLDRERKAHAKELKGEITGLQEEIMYLSQSVNDGFKAEEQTLPCFYDNQSHERCFVDMSTGEIVKREKAHPGDRQLRMV